MAEYRLHPAMPVGPCFCRCPETAARMPARPRKSSRDSVAAASQGLWKIAAHIWHQAAPLTTLPQHQRMWPPSGICWDQVASTVFTKCPSSSGTAFPREAREPPGPHPLPGGSPFPPEHCQNVTVFQHFKRLIDLRRRGEPRQIVRYINPKEAELLDAAAGIHVRFRLGGVKFPPDIYYKIFTHRPIEDLCANSPRDYTRLPAKYTSHIKSDNLQEEDHRGWYRRIENNGWRLVSDTFWVSPENVEVGDKKESEFHFSKLKRRQDMEKKRKIRKIEWMRKMYYTGSLEARSTNAKTLGLIHTATKGLMRAVEIGGIDSVMEWEVDEVLNWTNTLNFDEYIANWKEIATSNSSANFKSFPFEQARKRGYDYADISEEKLGIPEDTLDGSFYEKPNFPRLSPDLTYGV